MKQINICGGSFRTCSSKFSNVNLFLCTVGTDTQLRAEYCILCVNVAKLGFLLSDKCEHVCTDMIVGIVCLAVCMYQCEYDHDTCAYLKRFQFTLERLIPHKSVTSVGDLRVLCQCCCFKKVRVR